MEGLSQAVLNLTEMLKKIDEEIAISKDRLAAGERYEKRLVEEVQTLKASLCALEKMLKSESSEKEKQIKELKDVVVSFSPDYFSQLGRG